jgi:hypothetical protein
MPVRVPHLEVLCSSTQSGSVRFARNDQAVVPALWTLHDSTLFPVRQPVFDFNHGRFALIAQINHG